MFTYSRKEQEPEKLSTASTAAASPCSYGNWLAGDLVITVVKKLTYRERFKQWITLDRATDLTVDIFLIIFDVLTHPILIIVRIFRWFMNLWFVDRLKRMARWVAHWFERKRAHRLAQGHGILRTYWWLILLSPLIVAGIAAPLWMWVEIKSCWIDPNC